LVTFRRAGHSSSDDPTRYISAEVREKWEKLDPIDRFRTYLEGRGLWNAEQDEAFRKEARNEINQAIKDNERVANPELESIFSDVYSEMPADLKRALETERDARGEGRFP
jgi:pyruvate dehydrogenase E1 component alpha subunit